EQQYDVALAAADLPLESLVAFYRRAKLNVSDGLRAAGEADGELHLKSGAPCIAGNLRIADVSFMNDSRKLVLRIGAVYIAYAPQLSRFVTLTSCLVSTPVNIALGGKSPLILRLDWQPKQFGISVSGQAESDRLLAAVKSFGLIARDYHAE